VFGRVIGNMAALDAIERGEPAADPTNVVQATIAADGKPQKIPQQVVAAPAQADVSLQPFDPSAAD
jgi:peptidylprolyl isomerase